MNDEKYMKIALSEAKKAYNNNEVPVGAVIVLDNKIISKAYNKTTSTNISTNHAEIIAINKACKKINNWRLLNCIIYTTLEPCDMCYGAIKQSRIKRIVYGTKNNNMKNKNAVDKNILCKNMNDELCSKLLKQFFLNKR